MGFKPTTFRLEVWRAVQLRQQGGKNLNAQIRLQKGNKKTRLGPNIFV